MPAVLAPLIIRKPGAALFAEMVAAGVSALLGSLWGVDTLLSGFVQGAAAELVFAFTLLPARGPSRSSPRPAVRERRRGVDPRLGRLLRGRIDLDVQIVRRVCRWRSRRSSIARRSGRSRSSRAPSSRPACLEGFPD